MRDRIGVCALAEVSPDHVLAELDNLPVEAVIRLGRAVEFGDHLERPGGAVARAETTTRRTATRRERRADHRSDRDP